MPFLTEVHFQNYRSFLDTKCRLIPDKSETAVTVVIGANNAGKSNFLRGLNLLPRVVTRDPGPLYADCIDEYCADRHRGKDGQARVQKISVWSCDKEAFARHDETGTFSVDGVHLGTASLYRLRAEVIGVAEQDTTSPSVHSNGEGVTRVLKWLSLRKKRLFADLEKEFHNYVSEVEELLFDQADLGKWFIQVLEQGLTEPTTLSEMSEGTRTILALLTILYQPNRPELILIEDIEHAIHPRGLKPLVETMRKISKEHGVQIIFTTQSPYVLDAFQDPEHWDSVVIVEKRDGVSTLTNAKERLVALGYDQTPEHERLPLGDLWYSGLLGGVADGPEFLDAPVQKTTKEP